MKPPKMLTAAAKKWWLLVMEQFPQTDVQQMILIETLREWDDMNAADKLMKKQGGESFVDRYDQPRKHPLSDVVRLHRAAVRAGWKQLGIKPENLPEPPTPEDTDFEKF